MLCIVCYIIVSSLTECCELLWYMYGFILSGYGLTMAGLKWIKEKRLWSVHTDILRIKTTCRLLKHNILMKSIYNENNNIFIA